MSPTDLLPRSPHLSVRAPRDGEPGAFVLLASCPRAADDALTALWGLLYVVSVRSDGLTTTLYLSWHIT